VTTIGEFRDGVTGSYPEIVFSGKNPLLYENKSKFNAKPLKSPKHEISFWVGLYAPGDHSETAETVHRIKSQSNDRARPKTFER